LRFWDKLGITLTFECNHLYCYVYFTLGKGGYKTALRDWISRMLITFNIGILGIGFSTQ